MPPYDRALWALRSWLDSWRGFAWRARRRWRGLIVVLMFAATPTFADNIQGGGLHGPYPVRQDLPFAETTIVVVHPWTFGAASTYIITLDGAKLAALGAGQHVVWRTTPLDLILGMKFPDGLHPTEVLRAEPGRTYYFRTSFSGLDRMTETEGRSLAQLSTLVEHSWPIEAMPD